MNKGVGVILLLVAVATAVLVSAVAFKADYWLAPPEQKFARSWTEDVQLLESSKKLPKEWDQIREISLKTDNSPAQDWIATVKAPVKTTKDGVYKLDVFVIHWLEGVRYGVVIQYNLVDLRNQNTIWELGRTLRLGYIY